jgi:hypothetical protein
MSLLTRRLHRLPSCGFAMRQSASQLFVRSLLAAGNGGGSGEHLAWAQ